MAACPFDRVDTKGARWRIEGNGILKPAMTIFAGKTAELEVGPPFTARMTARYADEGTVVFGMDVLGRGGLRYSPASLRRAGKQLPAPRFEVRDDKGNVLHTGRFKYG